jgi:sirohydrochlorin cobaltochelatase
VSPGSGAAVAARRVFSDKAAAAWPELPLLWAFTGQGGHAGGRGPGLAEAMLQLRGWGIRRAALQPLHCIPGMEHETLEKRAALLAGELDFAAVVVGEPLLADKARALALAEAMRIHAGEHAASDEAVVWIGHGTPHAGQDRFTELAALLHGGTPRILTGALSFCERGVEETAALLTALGFSKALLAPFFAFSGRHAGRDLAGMDKNSWRSRLEAQGIACRVLDKGMAGYEAFDAIWLRHLADALAALEGTSAPSVRGR